jgi:hypothetical protein
MVKALERASKSGLRIRLFLQYHSMIITDHNDDCTVENIRKILCHNFIFD